MTFNIPCREFRVEIGNEALWALETTGRMAFKKSEIFRRFYEPIFFHLLMARKALKLLREAPAPPD